MTTLRGFSAAALSLVLLAVAAPVAVAAPATGQDTPTPSLPAEVAGDLPLEGTTWRLREFRWRDTQRTAGPEVTAWLSLRAGSLDGSGGCSRLQGRYGRAGDSIRIGVRDAGAPACAEQTGLVERAMVDGLRRALTFEILPAESRLAAQLSLRDADDTEVLRFTVDDVGSLTAETWRLVSYTVDGRSHPADSSQAAVLEFGVDGGSRLRRQWQGDVVGSSGCNGIVATYARQGEVISLAELERTDAPCTASLAAQEAAMVAVLESPSLRLAMPPDRLTLTTLDGDDSLELMSASPLEGSLWLAVTLLGRASGDSPVTLRLDEGVVSGEGPCGPYSGRYASDGVFIRFAELRGAGVDACADQKRQRDLLRALERAVLLDRDQPQLQMLDAGGEVVARFRRPTGP